MSTVAAQALPTALVLRYAGLAKVPAVIATDVDDTTLGFLTEVCKRYNRDYDDALTPDSFQSWAMDAWVKPECGRHIYDYIHDPTLYTESMPVPGAAEGIQALTLMGHRVIFASSCEDGTAERKMDRLVQLGMLTPTRRRKDFLPVSDKSLVRADVLVDDGTHNVEAFPGRAILYTRGHNRDYQPDGTRVTRANSWVEVVEQIAAWTMARNKEQG